MKSTDHLENSDCIKIEQVNISAYAIPTDFPESDGTVTWDSTTLALVEITAGNKTGIDFTYADASSAFFIGIL